MSSQLAGVTVAVLGGDDREIILASRLVRMGALVRAAGNNKLKGLKEVRYCGAIDEGGLIRARYSEKAVALNSRNMAAFRDDCIIIVGFARKLLQDLAAQRGLKLIEIAEMDEVAILNSIPTAEGAIQMAMEASDITIHGSNCLVLGFGRCGVTLARMLHALGAKTVAAARKPSDLARIREMGIEPITYDQLDERIGEADFIFNTVPVMMLNGLQLAGAKPDVYICDIASSPGGVDFEAAARLGLKAELAPALPGIVAPRSAGEVLAQVIPDIMAKELTKSPSTLGGTESSRGC